MKISIILAHPEKGSLNHAIASVAKNELDDMGHEVVLHDLYDEEFDPVLPASEIPSDAQVPVEIGQYCDELLSVDGIIIVHPNWWGQPPAILTGWIDRVIRPGVAYEFIEQDQGEGVPNGLLKGKSVMVLNTSNTPELREQEVFGDPLQLLWKNCIFDLCGVTSFCRRMFNVVVVSSEEQRIEWLKEVRAMVRRSFPGHKTT